MDTRRQHPPSTPMRRWVGLLRKRKSVIASEEPSKCHGDKEFDRTRSPDRPSSYQEDRPQGERDNPGEPNCYNPSHDANPEPRHTHTLGGPITSLVFLVDGKHIVSGCKDGSIRRWSVSDCREIGPAMKSDGAVNSVVASQDGKWIVSGGVDRKVTVWNATNHQKVWESSEPYGKAVTVLDISSDSSCVAAGSEDGSVIIWCLASGERITGPLKHQESQVSSVKFSPTGDRLASACTGWDCHSIRIWHSRTGDHLASLSADNKPTHSLAWSHDGQRLFAGGPRGSIRCFNMATQSIQSRLGDQLSDSVTSLCISSNDRFLVAGSASSCSLNLWDVNTCQLIHPTLIQSREVLSAAISPDDYHLVSGGMDKEITIRSLSDIVPMSYFFHRLTPSLKHSQPFTYMSKAVHGAWRQGNLEKAEEILSKEITNPDYPEFVTYSLANRALVRARMCKWGKAAEDAQTKPSNDTDLPPVAYVAKGFALFGQGNHQEATEAFDCALRICDDDARPFLDLVKFITLFEVGCLDEVEVIHYEIDPIDCFLDVKSIRSMVKAQILILLAERSMVEQNYDKAIQLLAKAQDLGPFIQVPELNTISLIFGWNLVGLERTIHQQKCKAFFASGRVRDAIDSLLVIQRDLKEEVGARKEVYEWLGDFKIQCLEASESLGEEAMRNNNHGDAVAWYSAALDLNPASPEHIFMKRGEAYAARGSWENALMDANEAIMRNASLFQACEMKWRALYNLQRYDEITKTWNELPESQHARAAIDETVKETLHNTPLRMIDTKTGHLCEEARLRSVFEGDPVFGELIVSMTDCMETARIKHVVKEFFQYVMFSHRWQGREPLCSDVGDQSVYSLPTEEMPTVIKLQTFCRTAGEAGYRWAWSDTCCIDQKNQREFEKSINSMFRWYHHSALTLIYLWDVLPSSLPGGLTRSAWITRGWTLQEFLAPPVIRFFNADWTPYLFDPHVNHKVSNVIMEEIANAVGVPANDLLSFHPSWDDVRWKLQMASKRDTTVPEDAAYCLFGIFSVTMSVIPGERQYQAVGRLLKEIVTCSKSGDVGCLAWVGEPSELNSCLPTKIKAYEGSCHSPVSIGESEMQRMVSELEPSFQSQDQAQALAFYDEVARQPRAEFNGWRLHLPCIAFRVTAFDSDRGSDTTNAYIARAAALEATRICTTDTFPPKGLLLVCPWIHELRDLALPHSSHQYAEADVESTFGHRSETRAVSVVNENPDESTRPPTPDNGHGHLNGHHEDSGPSTPSSLLTPSPSAAFDERTRALRFAACLRQPMTALLLSTQRHGVYTRVATDHDIVIQVRNGVSLDRITVKVVEII